MKNKIIFALAVLFFINSFAATSTTVQPTKKTAQITGKAILGTAILGASAIGAWYTARGTYNCYKLLTTNDVIIGKFNPFFSVSMLTASWIRTLASGYVGYKILQNTWNDAQTSDQ